MSDSTNSSSNQTDRRTSEQHSNNIVPNNISQSSMQSTKPTYVSPTSYASYVDSLQAGAVMRSPPEHHDFAPATPTTQDIAESADDMSSPTHPEEEGGTNHPPPPPHPDSAAAAAAEGICNPGDCHHQCNCVSMTSPPSPVHFQHHPQFYQPQNSSMMRGNGDQSSTTSSSIHNSEKQVDPMSIQGDTTCFVSCNNSLFPNPPGGLSNVNEESSQTYEDGGASSTHLPPPYPMEVEPAVCTLTEAQILLWVKLLLAKENICQDPPIFMVLTTDEEQLQQPTSSSEVNTSATTDSTTTTTTIAESSPSVVALADSPSSTGDDAADVSPSGLDSEGFTYRFRKVEQLFAEALVGRTVLGLDFIEFYRHPALRATSVPEDALISALRKVGPHIATFDETKMRIYPSLRVLRNVIILRDLQPVVQNSAIMELIKSTKSYQQESSTITTPPVKPQEQQQEEAEGEDPQPDAVFSQLVPEIRAEIGGNYFITVQSEELAQSLALELTGTEFPPGNMLRVRIKSQTKQLALTWPTTPVHTLVPDFCGQPMMMNMGGPTGFPRRGGYRGGNGIAQRRQTRGKGRNWQSREGGPQRPRNALKTDGSPTEDTSPDGSTRKRNVDESCPDGAVGRQSPSRNNNLRRGRGGGATGEGYANNNYLVSRNNNNNNNGNANSRFGKRLFRTSPQANNPTTLGLTSVQRKQLNEIASSEFPPLRDQNADGSSSLKPAVLKYSLEHLRSLYTAALAANSVADSNVSAAKRESESSPPEVVTPPVVPNE